MFKLAVVLLAVASTQVLAAPATLHSSLVKALKTQDSINIIITMADSTQPLLKQMKQQSFADRNARLNHIGKTLKHHAHQSQTSVLAFLAKQTNVGKVTSLWINNKIAVKGASAELIHKLSTMEGIQSIREDSLVPMNLPKPSAVVPTPKALQWGVEMVDAPGAWAQGYNGNGVVVAILDTGVRHTHKTLYHNYRKDYGWFDAYEQTATPIDTDGHGTHVMGSIVGLDGVGVAPGAEWIACRSSMYLSALSEMNVCGQFFLCPTLPDETEPDCTKAPHLVSNSWGYGSEDDEEFDSILEAWNAAGIIALFANGNSGDYCDTVLYPANSDYDLITVGATDVEDKIADFSSRGPSQRTGKVKPDISGPGVDVVSAAGYDDDEFQSMSGTSMATPHAAGVVALLLTNGTELTFNEVSEFLYQGATHTVPTTGANCGGIDETTYPNNIVGHGRLSATGAIARLLETRKA